MDELLFYAKAILLVVLLYDVIILFRKPEEGSKVVTLNFWKEMERKGINSLLIPCTMIFIISLDYIQKTEIYLSLGLLILSIIYLGYPRPFAFGKTGILLDGKIIVKDLEIDLQEQNVSQNFDGGENNKFVTLSDQLDKEFNDWEDYGNDLINRL